MKKLVSALALTAVTATSAFAHSGGTNSQGCHSGSQPYHCHNTPVVSGGGNVGDIIAGVAILGIMAGIANEIDKNNKKKQPVVKKRVVHVDPDVRMAQKFLNNKGYNLSVDGVWGKNTKRAVTNYFAQHNQVFDGKFDYKDLHAMYAMQQVVVQQPVVTQQPSLEIKVISTTVVEDKPKVYEYLFESHIMTAERLLKTCKLIKNRAVSKEDKEVLKTYAKVKNICGY